MIRLLAALSILAPTLALAEPPQLTLDRLRSGTYLGQNGQQLQIDAVYRAHFRRGEPKHLWNLAWQLGILAIGTTWYWTNEQANRSDWDFSDGDFAERFGVDAIRFDNNSFTINNISHPVAGAGYYLAARAHDYGVGMSSLISFGSSLFWEAGLEWRERISINDLVFTPGAGIAMGEAYYRLSHYLNSAPGGGSWLHKTAAWAIGWPVAVNRWIDDVEPVNDGISDSLGFSGAYRHRFRLAYETGTVGDDPRGDPGQLHGFRMEGDIYAVPGFQRPGRLAILFNDGNFTEFDVALLFADGELAFADVWLESVMLGYYQQDYEGPADKISGSAGTIALSFAFEHVQRCLPEPRDRRAILHLPGGHLKIWNAWRGVVHAVEIGLHPDFSAIDSLAFPGWIEDNPDQVERSVLMNHGYYFAWGGTTWVKSDVHYRGLSLAGSLRFSYANSIEGFDRHRDRITRQGSFEDTLVESRLALGYSDRPSLLSMRLELRRVERIGLRSEAKTQRQWNQLGFSAGLEF